MSDRFGGKPVVNEFEFELDTAIADGLNIKTFEMTNRKWAKFVIANRRKDGPEFHNDYDIVIGPVADDDIARVFGLFDMNIIDFDTVVKEITYIFILFNVLEQECHVNRQVKDIVFIP